MKNKNQQIKLTVQISLIVLVFSLYLGMFGGLTLLSLFFISLLSSLYAIFYKKKTKIVFILKILLFLVLFYQVYYFLSTVFTMIHIIKLFHPDIATSELLRRLYFDYFLNLISFIMILSVLIFNKTPNSSKKEEID